MADSAPSYRCLAIVDLNNEDALEANQAAWRADDPFRVLKDHGARRYVRGIAQRDDSPVWRPRSRLGAAQVWADDAATALDLAARMAGRGFLKAHPVLRDARLTVLATRELQVIGPAEEPPGDKVKSLFLVRRRPGLGVAAYQDYWRKVHGELVVGAPGVIRYMQMQRLAASYSPDESAEYDGAAEMSFPDWAAQEAFNTGEPYRTNQAQDLPNCFDLRAGIRFYVTEEAVF
jgi:uncharacterized protein (TIGR02118 family)